MKKIKIDEKKKNKVIKIIYHLFWFAAATLTAYILWDFSTYNKYSAVPYYKVKAFIFIVVICYMFIFGSAAVIWKQDEYIEELEKKIYKL